MSRFSTANLDNKFKFGSKFNNPVNNELLWRASVAQDNRRRGVSATEALQPHVQVNPYRNLLRTTVGKQHRPSTTTSDAAVANKLGDLQSLINKERERSAALDQQLSRVLGSSKQRYAHLIDAHQHESGRSAVSHRRHHSAAGPSHQQQQRRQKRQPRRRLKLKLPRTKPPPIGDGSPSKVSYKNRQMLSHNLMNYAF